MDIGDRLLITSKIYAAVEANIFSEEVGADGIAAARAMRPDVIILGLPGMAGAETLRLLKSFEDTEDIPIVVAATPVPQNAGQLAKKCFSKHDNADDIAEATLTVCGFRTVKEPHGEWER
jgi:CheY-like chemotaxis protein